MESKKIVFPNAIVNKFEVIKFFNEFLGDSEKEMYYDMEQITFFEASLVPFFHSINQQLFETHENIMYNKINKTIEIFFIRSKFATKFNSKYVNVNLKDIYKTYIEFTEFKKEEEAGFYIIEKKLQDKKLIDFRDEIQVELISLIAELTNNSYEHGRSENAYFCGQYYPQKHKLSFSISNLGRTINENVKEKNINFSDEKCLEWIFEEGTTTRRDGTNGGQGLFALKTIVKKLFGEVTVISGYDYFQINKKGNTTYKKLPNKYKGTTFIIDIQYNRRFKNDL